MSTTEELRAKFEKWAAERSMLIRRSREAPFYESERANLAWEAWKAAYSQGYKDALKWIPVEERLPEENVKVLIVHVAKFGNMHYPLRQVEYSFLADGEWFDAADTRTMQSFNDTTWEITHWMPLPEAPSSLPIPEAK